MHLHDLHTLFEYNAWAKARLVEVVETIPHEQYMKDFGSSHGGIHGTIFHIMGAEAIWLRRWKGESPASFWKAEEFPTFDALKQRWDMVEHEMLGFCHMLKSDEDIHRTIVYRDLKGNDYSQPLNQLMQHLVNHSTYHRGQVTTMLRLVDVKPPNTDLITYYREKSPRT